MPKVSILMGTHNHEDTLDEAVQSIVDQTFDDWELIICDDASTDGTYVRLQEWARKDLRIHVLHHSQNKKLACALNYCMEEARGIYIARMDDDDVSYPERLEKQVNFLDGHREFDFVSSLVDCYDGHEIVRNRCYRVAEPEKRDFLKISQFIHPAVIFRADCLKQVGGYRVAPETERVEDYDLFMRLYAVGYKGYNIQEPLLRYRVSLSAMKGKRKYKYRINEAIVRWKGFREMGLMPWGIPYAVRPLIVGLIPHFFWWNLFYKRRDSAV